jgi:hypothetical protein
MVIKSDSAYILANFSFLSLSVTELENTTNLVSEKKKGIISTEEKLNTFSSSKADAVE